LLLTSVADFRFEQRSLLQFSERAAAAVGLQPQQHQLLLQIAAAPDGAVVTIAYAAERLGQRHNSVVELVDRSVREGLLLRTADADDRRRVLLRMTRKGERLLGRLAADHALELRLAPRLAEALERICTYALATPVGWHDEVTAFRIARLYGGSPGVAAGGGSGLDRHRRRGIGSAAVEGDRAGDESVLLPPAEPCDGGTEDSGG
jgi:DNA-binding MarR family transcriptional regulator